MGCFRFEGSRAFYIAEFLKQRLPSHHQKPCYISHANRCNETSVGVGFERIIQYYDGYFLIESVNDLPTRIPCPSDEAIEYSRGLLDPRLDTFTLTSLDLKRQWKDANLPLMVLIQTPIQVTYTNDKVIHLTYSENVKDIGIELLKQEIEELLQFSPSNQPSHNDDQEDPQFTEFTPSLREWSGESDEEFLWRIKTLHKIIQNHPTKFIPIRTNQKLCEHKDPKKLYEVYTQLESAAVANHYFELPNGYISMGCSPENIFEFEGNNINFDVVAGTIANTSNLGLTDTQISDFLKDKKEVNEHLMAIDHYLKKIKALCDSNSIEVYPKLSLRKLRRVSHLYSSIQGKIHHEQDYFSLLNQYFPRLDSYDDKFKALKDLGHKPRGFYGAVVGTLSQERQVARCFQNLRSVCIHNDKLTISAGVGITKNSIPQTELQEAKNKLSCLLEAIAMWEKT